MADDRDGPQITLYGGKGGVGKTTCAAATALGAARAGESVLVVSTDPAHSLSDAFEVDIGPEVTEVRPNLAALEIDPEDGLEGYQRVFERLTEDLTGAGLRVADDDIQELFASGLLPGSDELAALDKLAAVVDEPYDRVVVDTAPTGHTLRLLDLPTAVGRGVETARSLGKEVRRKTDAAKTMLFGPYATRRRDDEADPFEAVLSDLETVRGLLRDVDRTDFRVVCLPERMVVAETERLIDQLRRASVPVGLLVVNRVLETEPDHCERCRARWQSQQTVLEDIDERFPDLQTVLLPDLTGQSEATLETLATQLAP